MRKYIIGVDVGGTSVKFGKFDLEGILLDKWSIRTDRSDKGEHILPAIVASIKETVDLKEIKGIGIGVPGPVKDNVVVHCVNLNWGRRDLVQELHLLLQDKDIIIRAGNDANVAAAGEMYKGAARGYRTVVMYTLGTGIGGGIVLNGELMEGVNGAGAELGHTIVDFRHNFPCNCGKKGCLETVASATGIISLAKENLIRSKAKSPLRRYESFSAKKVIDYAKEGDFISLKTIDEAMKYLALAIANVSLTLDPEIILIGGGVSHAGQFLIDLIEKYFYQMTDPFIKQANIQIASLGNDAGIYGCAYLIQ
ncbi:MAG: ROK family glucokinase [Bacilli bacterium]|nr:ROK family glucokinase [Bacilli bacterium]MBN2877911.1 ROK family glucokinase [Bacilli bacterium]